MAICSDLDETPDSRVYYESMRFLNTTDTTAMGPGVGLEVGNTIYFQMPPDQFAYWNTDEAGRDMVRSPHPLRTHRLPPFVWRLRDDAGRRRAVRSMISIATAAICRCGSTTPSRPTNFGADIMEGAGDLQARLPTTPI